MIITLHKEEKLRKRTRNFICLNLQYYSSPLFVLIKMSVHMYILHFLVLFPPFFLLSFSCFYFWKNRTTTSKEKVYLFFMSAYSLSLTPKGSVMPPALWVNAESRYFRSIWENWCASRALIIQRRGVEELKTSPPRLNHQLSSMMPNNAKTGTHKDDRF